MRLRDSILVIEDDPAVGESLRDSLRRGMFRGDTVFQSGRIVIQQIVSPVDSLDGLGGNVEVQVWGTEQGDAIVAEVLVYREIT